MSVTYNFTRRHVLTRHTIINNNTYNPDCLKMYNLLIYSSPFILCNVFTGGDFTHAMFLHAPFELVATNFQTFITSFPFEDPSFPLRMQMRLEGAIPEGTFIHNAYHYILEHCSQGRRYAKYGIYSGILSTIAKLVLYSNITRTESTDMIPFAQTPTGFSQEEFDLMVTVMVNVILQL